MQQALPMEATLLHFVSVLVFALSYCSSLSMGTVNLCFSHIPFSYSTLPLVQDLSAGRKALYITQAVQTDGLFALCCHHYDLSQPLPE